MAVARPYFPSLDGLRCFAILPIVWHHSTTGQESGVLGRGPLGVDLFFAISGFLITSLLLDERRQEGILLSAFWIRRALRIFPLYYVVLGGFVLHALLVRPAGPVREYFIGALPFYATYTSNWFLHGAVAHPIVFSFAWSLATEEQFYLLWPPVLRACPRRALLVPAIVMSGLCVLDQAAERGWLEPYVPEGLALRMIRSFATPIALGALLALATEHPIGSRIVRAVLGHRASSAIALTLVLVAVIRPWPVFPTHIALTTLVGACAIRRDHVLAPLLESRVIRHVGAVSYGIYLLNISVVSAVRAVLGANASALVVFGASIVLSVGAATLVYRWVERPFLALRDRFRAPPAVTLRGPGAT